MKHFVEYITKLALFFLLLFVVDRIAGKAFSYMVANAKGGDNGRNNYICNQTNEDVLVFGSSRAIHHYNPRIISDSLGLSCYNCGQDGNGSILNYGRYQLILQRYCPKLVIYDIMPDYDLLEGEDNHRFLGWLRAYYDRPGIKEIFEDVDVTEKYKIWCKMYRYNTKCIQIASDYVHPLTDEGYQGFRPLVNEMDTMKVSLNVSYKEPVFDSLKIAYLNKFIKACGDGTKLIVVYSPVYRKINPKVLAPIEQICHQEGILFLDYSSSTEFFHNKDLYSDGNHLNAKGADRFTRDLMTKIKNKYSEN